MQVDFDSLGTYLRQERERQHVSLQDVAAATKIQHRFLEALEHDAYDQLPAEPFVLGFLRAYAQYMALDPALVLTAYRSLHRTAEAVEPQAKPAAVASPPPARRQLGRLGVFVALFGILTGFVLYEWRRGQQTRNTVTSFPAALPTPGQEPPAVTKTIAPAAAPPEPPRVTAPALVAPPPPPVVQTEPRPALPTLGTSEAVALPTPEVSEPAKPAAEPARQETLVLEAKAVSDTWLGIEIDGEKRLNLLLTAGKSARWEAQERFRVTVGNTRGTHLALNGQDVPLRAGRSNVTRDLVLTRAQLP